MKATLSHTKAILATLASLLATGAHASIVVNEGNMNSHGWFHASGGTGTSQMVNGIGTPPLGTGSANLSVGSDGNDDGEIRNTAYNGTRIDSLTALGYSAYATGPTTGQMVYIMLMVDNTSDGGWDDILFFEPEYQHGYTSNVPDQGQRLDDTWQSWDALTGGWWSVNSVGGLDPGANVNTLATYLGAEPNATIVNTPSGGVRLTTGNGAPVWDNHVGYVDAFTIGNAAGTTTFDFEAVPEPASFAVLGLGAAALIRRRRKK